MARLDREDIVAELEAHGLRFRTLTLQTEGDYLPADVDWNNKDVLHLNHVHSWVKDVTCVVDRDLQASISMQKALGIPFPLVLVHYESGPNEHTHFVTILAWTIVTRHDFIPVTPTRTRAVTSYAVGASRFWMLFFPLIAFAIRRNYRRLMAEDVPLRERRGLLRSWGYRFRGDDGPRDIRASLSVTGDNVLPPEGEDDLVLSPLEVALSTISERDWTLVGRSDHRGLKLRRRGRHVLAYPRMCPHEGADLDDTPVTGECLTCPWHGRQVPPVADLDLDADAPEVATPSHRLRVDDDKLIVVVEAQAASISPAATGEGPGAEPGRVQDTG